VTDYEHNLNGRAAMTQDECVQALTDLGLTLLQTKVYLALSKAGKATIKTVAKSSNIARQDVYRIMPALQKIGLAEKMVAAPTMYKATPLKEGISILLQNRTREYIELQEEATKLLNSSHECNDETPVQDEGQQFSIISSETLLFKRLAEKDNATQLSMDVAGEWNGIRFMLFNRFEDFQKALKRGVRIRIITEKHECDKTTEEQIQTLSLNPLFAVRYLSSPIPVKTIIHDRTEVNMCIAIPCVDNTPSLWSNNPQFVNIMVVNFEEMWKKAANTSKPLPPKNAKVGLP
jgi:sugar-specific transcriptional regulator TrmB